ncbi:hypothetical protein C8Q72DRAFT_885694 [Fomitopsis betulina]|nr:hypothetical protein C8Q72DRAFT_885694 [Fomitopsis betulina]
MNISAVLATILLAMGLPTLSAPIALPREMAEHLCDKYRHQPRLYKTCLTLQQEKLVARHGSSGGKPQSLTDLHVAWALHRQTLDDEEVAAVHEAYRGTPAPQASNTPSHQGESNQPPHQHQSQSNPRELMDNTAREPSIEDHLTTHGHERFHQRILTVGPEGAGMRSEYLATREYGKHDESSAYPLWNRVEMSEGPTQRQLHVLGYNSSP